MPTASIPAAIIGGGLLSTATGLFSKVKPKPPPPPAPMPVPADQDPAAMAALRRKSAMDSAGGSGRDSTILTDTLG